MAPRCFQKDEILNCDGYMFRVIFSPYLWILILMVSIIFAALYPIAEVTFVLFFLWFQKVLGLPWHVKTGAEAMIGKRAELISPFTRQEDQTPQAWVKVGGERWRARANNTSVLDLVKGDHVVVVGREGLLLDVDVANRPASVNRISRWLSRGSSRTSS